MKKIQNYLHLYLGCEVIGYHKAKDEDGVEWIVTELRKRLVKIDTDGRVWLSGNVAVQDFKPLLRPLSDMTQEEFEWFADELMLHNIDAFDMAENIREGCTPSALCYALSKHFDIFGLIDAGLAIDKTKWQDNQST